MYSDSITVLTGATATNRYTDEYSSSLDWTNPTQTEVDGVSVQPVRSESGRSAGGGTKYGAVAEVTVSELRIFTPRGVDIPNLTAQSRVLYNGDTYYLTGEPTRWPAPSDTGVHHLEATLRRVEG